jgi:glyoxylase-like metal-dependent hydrolase (beta-lactamase superfamily II)/rhodanese-related sulfurtransferase
LIGSGGEAAVVDPRRDVDEYIEEASRNGLEIRHVIETHLHADFVSGHCELAERTGARIYLGAGAKPEFEAQLVHDGDEVTFGDVTLRFLETPGHTPESICVLLFDRSRSESTPIGILTGDTLFIGDVGRPDLVAAKGYSADQMAGMLYESLHEKILPLPDSVIVYPAHGAGSACGKNIGKETFATLGSQRIGNYALQPMSRDEFVQLATADLPEPPKYFPFDADMNRRGPQSLTVLASPTAFSPQEVADRQSQGHCVLDVRENIMFGAGHVPASANIGLGGQFAFWCGSLLDPAVPVILVADSEAGVKEAVTRLARVGFQNVTGFLDGGIARWREAGLPLETVEQISVNDLAAMLEADEGTLQVFDVRRPGEYAGGHVPGAVNVPLNKLTDNASLESRRPTAVICAGGYRSSAATSLLAPLGFHKLYNVLGGTSAWIAAGHATEPAHAVTCS